MWLGTSNRAYIRSFSTTFPATENPISQGGVWTLGGTTGLDWKDIQTTGGTPGIAFGVGVSAGYDDCIGHLSGFKSSSHRVTATCNRVGGYSPGVSHECELLLLFTIGAHSARGYEITCQFNADAQFVRWNGALGDFDVLTPTGTGVSGGIVDGDVMQADATLDGSGNPVLTLYRNGTQIYTYTDTSAVAGKLKVTSGQPGMGFFARAGATMSSYCWRSFSAVDL